MEKRAVETYDVRPAVSAKADQRACKRRWPDCQVYRVVRMGGAPFKERPAPSTAD